MTDEAGYKRKLVREVNALPGGYACRVEDRWRPGVLDMFIKLPQHPALWAEAKLITGNVFGPTERQFIEGARLIGAEVPALLIGWKHGMMHVSMWKRKADARECYCDEEASFAQTLINYLRSLEYGRQNDVGDRTGS